MYQSQLWLLVCLWTVAVAGSLTWNLREQSREVEELALQTGRALFEKDLLFREWSTLHGGVYVPVSERTKPNPYLKTAERDIITPSGKQLTLMNPAYMTRQIFELQDRHLGVRGHITSLNPIRAENEPDAWERSALGFFEETRGETNHVETVGGVAYLRLMRPLVASEGCMKCHQAQVAKAGDIRGGISVMVPLKDFVKPAYRANLALAHGVLWVVGLLGLVMGSRGLKQEMHERKQAEVERERLIVELQEALQNVKTLSGLVPICATCKKVRDDQGYWHQVERYVQAHSSASFSHGICPDCMRQHYAEALLPEKQGASARPPGFPLSSQLLPETK